MRTFFKYPWVIVAVISAVTVFFALQLPRADMDNNVTSFLPENTPAKQTARHFEEEYGDTTALVVGLEKPYGTVFESAFLARVKDFTLALKEMPLVKKVTSLLSTQYITSDSESILVTDLVAADFSGTPDEIAELKRRLDSWDMYRGALVSDDLSATQIVVQLTVTPDHSGDPEVRKTLLHIRDTAKAMFADSASVYTAGQAVVSATLTESAFADLAFLIPLVVVVLLGVLIFSFRQITFVLLPLLTVIISAIWSIGAMPLFGFKLTLLSIVLPVILIAVGSAYGIHVISHYKDGIFHKALSKEEHRDAVFQLVRTLTKPVFLAALTTFAGFLSFCFSPISSMRDFGMFSCIGVTIAFLAALTFIPAVLLLQGPKKVKAAKAHTEQPHFSVDDFIARNFTAIARHRGTVLVLAVLLIGAALSGAVRVITDNAMVEFFSAKSEVNRSDRFIREHFGGSTQIILSVEAETTETLLHPDTLSALDGLCSHLTERVPRVGKVTGFTDMLKRLNQMFNVGESPEHLASGGNGGNGDTGNTGQNDDFDDFAGFGDFDDFGEISNTDTIEGGGLPPQEQHGVFATQKLPSENAQAFSQPPATPPADAGTAVTFGLLNAALGSNPRMSGVELVRRLEQLTNYEGLAYYEIPTDPARYGKRSKEELQRLIAGYLVFLSGDPSESFANDMLEPTAIETVVLVNSQWVDDTTRVINEINKYVEVNFPPNVTVVVGGGATQEGAISNLVTRSQTISIFIAVLAVLLIVAFSNRSLIGGVIAALPLLIAILFNFAIMGALRITLNMATAMIASLAVGIGIDYTIHFIEALKREYAGGGDYLYRTYATTGKAIFINAVSVGVSFAVLIFSRFRILGQFGILVAFSMLISGLVSLTVVPALLETIKPKFIYRGKK
jgi:predicted RND superfamily exporter protein